MANRDFDDSAKFREYVADYLQRTRVQSFAGAYEYVVERSEEDGITPPHSDTVRRLLIKGGYRMRLVKVEN